MSRAAELREVADYLHRLADDEERSEVSETDVRLGSVKKPEGDPVYLGRLAEALIRIRRMRDSYFHKDLFADPAWDMLLDLFVQRCLGRRVAITSACYASHVSQTTALRWLSLLEERGLVSREEDRGDRRRAFVGLTPTGEAAVARYLIAAGAHFRLARPVTFMLADSRAS